MSKQTKSEQKSQKRKPKRSVGVQLRRMPGRSHGAQYLQSAQWIWGQPGIMTTTAGGVFATAYACEPTANILGWARFSALFDEYRVIGVKVTYYPVVSNPATNPAGVMVGWFDEVASAAPTANESVERELDIVAQYAYGATPLPRTMTWKPQDLYDLEFKSTGTAFAGVYAKFYTSTALWGVAGVSNSLGVVRIRYNIEFRGLKST